MKDLIITVLNEVYKSINNRTPQTRKEAVYLSIEDVEPLEIADFMKANNVPCDAYFGGEPNSYDSFDRVCLVWDIDVLTTDKEKLKFVKTQFNNSFGKVNKYLSENGYKRKGFNSGLLKQFDDTTVYDMYINKQFDRLVKYYSLYFDFPPILTTNSI